MTADAETKTAIRKQAERLGFGRVGFCPAGATPKADFLDEWLAAGRHGTMGWLARNSHWRKDIRARYEWARGFVVVTMEYPHETPARLPSGSAVPLIARYARGADYHDVHAEALGCLQEEVIRIGGPGTKALAYQDTGPFLERAIARQAGLGWVGKNTMLIDPARGSWSFLALVVTSIDFAPDAPGTDHCGTCTRCLDACPTDAFPAPYQLDATRCVSYLTIEHKGAIAQELRPGIGEWLFGCDICNEVCPWNSKASAGAPELSPDFEGLSLARILTGKPEHLKKRIVGTPLDRAGEARLKRNAAIVAGNRRDQSLLPSLEQAARHEETFVRDAAYWAMARIGGKAGRAALARAQRHELDDTLRDGIIRALQELTSA